MSECEHDATVTTTECATFVYGEVAVQVTRCVTCERAVTPPDDEETR